MDKVHAYIKDEIEFHSTGEASLDKLIERYREMIGFDWIYEKENPWDYRDVEFPELELRSALEFVRPELTEKQLAVLAEIDGFYQDWIRMDIFYTRYREAQGGRFTWQSERDYVSEQLGRSIPKSHWWLWPPEE